MVEGDLAFVVSTWVLSMPAPHWMAERAYRTNMRRAVASAMKHSKTVVLASREHEATIMGWACGVDGAVLHAYFRPGLRENAVGRAQIQCVVREAMKDGGH